MATKKFPSILAVVNDMVSREEKAIKDAQEEVPLPNISFPGFYYEFEMFQAEDAFTEKLSDIERAHTETVEEIAIEMNQHLELMMRASWGWEGGSRDIVDSGELLRSGGAIVSGDSIEISYQSPYANLVHYGGYIQPYGNQNISKVYIPGRPWIAATLGEANGPIAPFDWKESYQTKMSQKAR